MNPTLLEKAGLSQNEAKVYLALLACGQSTSGPLIKETRLNSAKVYESLTRLQNKGLVGYISKEGKKCFNAMSSEMLVKLIEGRQEQLNRDKRAIIEVLPQLNILQKKETSATQSAAIYYGPQNYKVLAERMLQEIGECGTFIAISSIFKHKVDPYWCQFQRKKRCMCINSRALWSKTVLKQKGYLAKYYGEGRIFADKDYISPVDILVYNDKVIQVCYTNKTFFTVFIKSKGLSDSYRFLFESVWRTAKPPPLNCYK